MKQKVPESGVLRACLDLLAAEHIWHERRNTVPVMVSKKGGGVRPIKVAKNGTGDIMATPLVLIDAGPAYHVFDGAAVTMRVQSVAVLWIECKSDSGKQSQAQKDFEKQAKAAGHNYIVVRSSDEVKRWLIDHGAMREK